ncbi:hypothetical protein NADFUDRAFT_81524 [Nadsonia fulvescens var. elongata DSM 6958]|uniref:Uncharacterized protein n=1 Tax=Nadsonia fulvescens var. elongata DSM 6958 TaxID=857566 RepID=A0A1E3PUW7_9ASCO|nr:hypothetical protein NADFUDRAFT_81524 [Nadsonia fulvescens var. elongata DSM 6958]
MQEQDCIMSEEKIPEGPEPTARAPESRIRSTLQEPGPMVIKQYNQQLITHKWLKVLNLPMAHTNKQVLEQVRILKEYYNEAMEIRKSDNFEERSRYFNMHPFSQNPRDLDRLIE